MTNLKGINFGLNMFCGPAVMSALTGKSTDECASVIMSITGKTMVEAVKVEHLLAAFKKLRFESTRIGLDGYSLYRNLTSLVNYEGLYIVLVHKHIVAIEVKEKKVYLVDNVSKEPLQAESSARLTQKVLQIYKLTPMPEPKFLRTEIHINRYELRVFISAADIYDIETVTRHLGSFIFKNDYELNVILDKIKETIR